MRKSHRNSEIEENDFTLHYDELPYLVAPNPNFAFRNLNICPSDSRLITFYGIRKFTKL